MSSRSLITNKPRHWSRRLQHWKKKSKGAERGCWLGVLKPCFSTGTGKLSRGCWAPPRPRLAPALWLQREFTCSYLSFSNMSSRKRVGWKGEQMKEAVDAVNGGMKIKPAALKYCVPRKTLSDYVRRGNTDKLRSGPLTIFTLQQELELVNWSCKEITASWVSTDTGWHSSNGI